MTAAPSRDRNRSRTVAGVRPLLATCRVLVVAVAFWLAIVLPLLYGPLLLVDGLVGPGRWSILALVAVHAATVAVGQKHSDARSTSS